jgi:preprotein translocase subunit SecA
MGKVYKGLVRCWFSKSNSSLREKRESYHSDITYVTNSSRFDFLRDSSAYNLNELVQNLLVIVLLMKLIRS